MTDRIGSQARDVEPRVVFAFRSTTVPGALANAPRDFSYQVLTSELFDCTLTFTPRSGAPLVLRRSLVLGDPAFVANDPQQRFDSGLEVGTFQPIDAYVFNRASASDLDRIFDARDLNRLTITATLQIQYRRFSLLMLEQMTRTAADTFTLGNPAPADRTDILATFRHHRSRGHARVTYLPKEQVEISDIPCTLEEWSVRPSWGPEPLVKLGIYLSVRERLSAAERDQVTRIFMAADHTNVHDLDLAHPVPANAPTPSVPPPTQPWERHRNVMVHNLVRYLWNHTDMRRAQRIWGEVYRAGIAALGRPQLDAVRALRDAIDERLVTANHWADDREDWNTERYQRMLSDLFGAVHALGGFASPVALLRMLIDDAHLGLDAARKAELALQYGVGHCGEHANVAYATLRAMIGDDPRARALFVNVINCGYANVDHAFVLGGFAISELFLTTARNEGLRGTPVFLFDLQTTLAPVRGVDGFVLDPYLAPASHRPRTARDLLRFIMHRPRSRGRDLRTPYLLASAQYPAPRPAPRTLPVPPRNI